MALRGTEGLSAEDVLRVSFARGELKTVIKEIHP